MRGGGLARRAAAAARVPATRPTTHSQRLISPPPPPPRSRAMAATARATARPNALAHERSPYLRQHAHNAVRWLPWGPEALAKSAAEGKPVLLSSGYSTCHWCHVMADSDGAFNDPDVAAIVNAAFVPVKVDREERPDVDGVYMAYLTATQGHGGWPLTAFLTPAPHLTPLFAGTYYPAGAFRQLCERVAAVWADEAKRPHLIERTKRLMDAVAEANGVRPPPAMAADAAAVQEGSVDGEAAAPADGGAGASKVGDAVAASGSGGGLADALRNALAAVLGGGGTDDQPPSASPPPAHAWLTALGADASEAALSSLRQRFDPAHGGFGHRPKFPRPTELGFLTWYAGLAGGRRRPRPTGPPAATVASVPFMVTRAMKAQLADAGFTPDEIRNMTPSQAHAHLQRAKEPPAAAAAPAPAPEPVAAGPPPGWPVDVRAVEARIAATQLAVAATSDDPAAPPPLSLAGLPPPEAALAMAWYTYRRVAAGGVHDHLGGGFHRYSTDAGWRVPHFELMAYDQAGLLRAAADLYALTGDPSVGAAGLGIVQYVLRDLRMPPPTTTTAPPQVTATEATTAEPTSSTAAVGDDAVCVGTDERGFFSAEDADSAVPPGREALPRAPWAPESSSSTAASATARHAEGAFYLWTASEVHAALRAAGGDLAAASPLPVEETIRVACAHYMLPPPSTTAADVGNTGSDPSTDPHGELYGLSVLAETGTIARTAAATGHAPADVAAALAAARRVLAAHRAVTRARPFRDEKVLTAWNGQLVAALARAAVTLAQTRGPSVDVLAGAAASQSPLPPGALPPGRRRELLATVGPDAAHYLPVPQSSSAAAAAAPLPPEAVYAACVDAAEGAVRFIRAHLARAAPVPAPTGDAAAAPAPPSHPTHLLRSYYDGAASSTVPGFLDDYTALIDGLLELYAATGRAAHLEWAAALQREQDAGYLDPRDGGVYLASRAADGGGDAALLFRAVPDADGAEPCANAVAALNLLRLGALTGDAGFTGRAHGVLRYFARQLRAAGGASPLMAAAAGWAAADLRGELTVVEVLWPAGDGDEEGALRRTALPAALFAAAREPSPAKLIVHRHGALPHGCGRRLVVQACRGHACTVLHEYR